MGDSLSPSSYGAIALTFLVGVLALYVFAVFAKQKGPKATQVQVMTDDQKHKRLLRLQQFSNRNINESSILVDSTSPTVAPSAAGEMQTHSKSGTKSKKPSVLIKEDGPPSERKETENENTCTGKKESTSEIKVNVQLPAKPSPRADTSTTSITSASIVPTEAESTMSSAGRFRIDAKDGCPETSTEVVSETTPLQKRAPSSSPSQLQKRAGAAQRVEALVASLLQQLPAPAVSNVKISLSAPSSAISTHVSVVSEGVLRITVPVTPGEGVGELTLRQIVETFGDSDGSMFFARDILECFIPQSSSSRYSGATVMSALRLQLEWLSKVHAVCDPLHSFSHNIERFFSTIPSSSRAKPAVKEEGDPDDDPLQLGQALVGSFRAACVSLGQALLAPCDQQASPEDEDEDGAPPPLFADEPAFAPSSSGKEGRDDDDVSCVLFDLVKQQVMSSNCFCAFTADFLGILRAFFTRAMADIRAATMTNNVFAQVDCDIFSAFPVSSLDALLAAAPALAELVAQNITACNALGAALQSSGGVSGEDMSETFLLTDLFCITQALALPPTLTLGASPLFEPWTKLLSLRDNGRAVSSRLSDIDRIIQRVRAVTVEVFKHVLSVAKGRYKKDVMEFFAHVLALSHRRALGRSDDPQDSLRGFEPAPECRALSRHFVFGAADLVALLLARGGVRVFRRDSFLNRRGDELADVKVVAPLCSGELCKCNFDVFLLFSSVLMTSALDREVLRQSFVADHMRKQIAHSRLSPEQKEPLERSVQAYVLSSSCQAARSESIDHLGETADVFCQYLIQLTHSGDASNCFHAVEQSQHNIYQTLSFIWSSLARVKSPAAGQVMAAERVVYLSSILLNRPDLLSDVKQQNHWVSILHSIGGRILHVQLGDEFRDKCVSMKPRPSSPDEESSLESSANVPKPNWSKHSPSKRKEASAYFGSSATRGPFVGAIFDSERNVCGLPLALARLYISSQSVEGWDADRDKSFDKFGLRQRIGQLLSACLDHPLHSEAVLASLSSSPHSDGVSVLGTLFVSVIDQNTSNFAFLNSIIMTAMDAGNPSEEMKKKYGNVTLARGGVAFLLKLCGERTLSDCRRTAVKLSNHVLQLCHVSALISNSVVDLGLEGTRNCLDSHVLQLTTAMVSLGGDSITQVLVDCCVDRGVRLQLPEDPAGLNAVVARRWLLEDALLVEQKVLLQADGDSDDSTFLMVEVQRALDEDTFVARYNDTVMDVCGVDKAVESVNNIPGYRFKKIAQDSLAKGTPRLNILKAWKAVAKCLANTNKKNFHPNGAILIKYLETDASCARAVISINMDTPYAFGLFFFDIWLTPDYPQEPPLCELVTNGDQSFMLSPNLYSCGKVCMSLLNTAPSGSDIEKWQRGTSTVAQVLLTIQTSLLGDAEPLTKEGKLRGSRESLAYNEEKHFETVKWGMLDALENGARRMGPEFGVFIQCHFFVLREQVRRVVRAWWLGSRKDRRLERVFLALLRELKTLPPPPASDENKAKREAAS